MNIINVIAIGAIPVLFAITLHEVAHGWVALKYGDHTASLLGRLSLNPFKHIDPIGTVLIPIALIIMTGVGFGWAKPVPVNFNLLRNPKKDMIWVAAAGPGANLAMLIFWAIVMKLAYTLGGETFWLTAPIIFMSSIGIVVNAVLMLVNLIPIPPLDGGRVLAGMLPNEYSRSLIKLEPYGMFIVFGVLFVLIKNNLLEKPFANIFAIIGKIFGIPI